MRSFRNSHRTCSTKKGVLKNFTKFTGKHLCQSLFFNKILGQSTWTTASVAYQKVLGIEFSKLEKKARMNTRKPNYHNLHRGWTIVILEWFVINYLFYQLLWEFVTKWICSNKRNSNTRNNNFLSVSKISFMLLLISIMIKMLCVQ